MTPTSLPSALTGSANVTVMSLNDASLYGAVTTGLPAGDGGLVPGTAGRVVALGQLLRRHLHEALVGVVGHVDGAEVAAGHRLAERGAQGLVVGGAARARGRPRRRRRPARRRPRRRAPAPLRVPAPARPCALRPSRARRQARARVPARGDLPRRRHRGRPRRRRRQPLVGRAPGRARPASTLAAGPEPARAPARKTCRCPPARPSPRRRPRRLGFVLGVAGPRGHLQRRRDEVVARRAARRPRRCFSRSPRAWPRPSPW